MNLRVALLFVKYGFLLKSLFFSIAVIYGFFQGSDTKYPSIMAILCLIVFYVMPHGKDL